jgi:hypothetical protein
LAAATSHHQRGATHRDRSTVLHGYQHRASVWAIMRAGCTNYCPSAGSSSSPPRSAVTVYAPCRTRPYADGKARSRGQDQIWTCRPIAVDGCWDGGSAARLKASDVRLRECNLDTGQCWVGEIDPKSSAPFDARMDVLRNGRWSAAPSAETCLKSSAGTDSPRPLYFAIFLPPIANSIPGNGHTAAPALPGACLDHEYGALHSHVAGALQGYLALICDWRWTRSGAGL